MRDKFRVVENKENLGLDKYHKVPLVQMKRAIKKSKVPEQVKVLPNDRERQILEAAMDKYGLKKAQDIISMALTRFAESEQLLKVS